MGDGNSSVLQDDQVEAVSEGVIRGLGEFSDVEQTQTQLH